MQAQSFTAATCPRPVPCWHIENLTHSYMFAENIWNRMSFLRCPFKIDQISNDRILLLRYFKRPRVFRPLCSKAWEKTLFLTCLCCFISLKSISSNDEICWAHLMLLHVLAGRIVTWQNGWVDNFCATSQNWFQMNLTSSQIATQMHAVTQICCN